MYFELTGTGKHFNLRGKNFGLASWRLLRLGVKQKKAAEAAF